MPLAPSIDRPSTQSPSLRSFLADLPEEDILRISEPMELDYLPTALILELEKRRRTPVVMIERPKGFDCPVVDQSFASRDRIARMVGAEAGRLQRRLGARARAPDASDGGRHAARCTIGPAGQRAGCGHAADQPPLREGRRAIHRLRHPGLQGSGHRRAQSELSTATAQRAQPLRSEPAFARPHLGASATLRGAPAKSRSRDRDRRASCDQSCGRREGGDGGRRIRRGGRAARSAGRTCQMQDH